MPSPLTSLDADVGRIWADVLGLERVDLDGDFFELGGDSLAAAMLAEAIEAQLGFEVPISALLSLSTARHLAAELAAGVDIAETIVAIHAGGRHPPLFAVHDLFGYIFFAKILADELGDDQPVYALSMESMHGRDAGGRPTIATIADEYVAAIRAIQPNGPYHIYGQCFGGVIAFEMASQLARAEQEVRLLAIGDAPAPSLLASGVAAEEAAERVVGRAVRKIAELRQLRGRAVLIEATKTGARLLSRGPSARRRARRRDFLEMCKVYRPQHAYPGSVVLIRSEEGMGPEDSGDRGWGRDVDGSVHTVQVSCAHDEIGGRTFLSAVAAELAAVLAEDHHV